MSVKYINEESSRLPIPGMGRQDLSLTEKKKEGAPSKDKKEKKGDPKKEAGRKEDDKKRTPEKRK